MIGYKGLENAVFMKLKPLGHVPCDGLCKLSRRLRYTVLASDKSDYQKIGKKRIIYEPCKRYTLVKGVI